MKIYIATSGEYSSYGIDAVFTDKRKAMYYCAGHGCYLEEHESDVYCTAESIKKPKKIWYCQFNKDGTVGAIYDEELTFTDIFLPKFWNDKPYEIKISVDATKTQEEVVKIIYDKLAQYKAEQENIL